MQHETALVVSDVHLGHAADGIASAFHRFLARVPDLAGHLVINGDLFDFWFEYRSVIPRRAFPTLAALHHLRQAGVALTVTGGNHDRWGGAFWERELDAVFHPAGARMTVGGLRALVTHGDGLSDSHLAARVMHRVTRWRITAAVFRLVHPDLGYRLVDKMSGSLADHTRDPAVLARAAQAQSAFARGELDADPDLDLVVLGHTHRAALEAIAPGRWYLNPGAWMDGFRYATIAGGQPALCRFEAAD